MRTARILVPAAPRDPAPPRRARLLWIGACTLLLLLAVRWCARTYPGLYFPDSAFLNDLLNGAGLFTVYGYAAVLLGGAAAAGRVFVADTGHRSLAAALRLAQWASLAVVALIVCYGLYWAQGMHRLPWQEDGIGPFLSVFSLPH
jgi:hypothetical protein